MNDENPLDRLTGARRAMSEVRKPEPQDEPSKEEAAKPAPAAPKEEPRAQASRSSRTRH